MSTEKLVLCERAYKRQPRRFGRASVARNCVRGDRKCDGAVLSAHSHVTFHTEQPLALSVSHLAATVYSIALVVYLASEGAISDSGWGDEGGKLFSLRCLQMASTVVRLAALAPAYWTRWRGGEPSAVYDRAACLALLCTLITGGFLLGLEGSSPRLACSGMGPREEESADACLSAYARTAVAHLSIVYVLTEVPLKAVVPLEVTRCGPLHRPPVSLT